MTNQLALQQRPAVVDPVQLNRIEAVHRGFLFQHLYAARSLLLAPGTDVISVVVESDEDVEVVRPGGRTYVQVKCRGAVLGFSEIEDALARFDAYRALHAQGERTGRAAFVIATNAALTPSLVKKMSSADWPKDVRIDHPSALIPSDPVTPVPAATLHDAFVTCRDLAALLPFAMLAPETLVWKLAGAVMLAAAGAVPRVDHAFQIHELAALFEQLVIQLQDLPTPPPLYRPQTNEPPLVTDAPVRLVTGYSGAGKTSWVSQAAVHAPGVITYFDARDTPGTALASSLAREFAARLFGNEPGGLGQVLLPGASGLEILNMIGRQASARSLAATVVVDNVQSPPAADVRALVQAAPGIRFVLLGQPGTNVQALSALIPAVPEHLGGWSPDTIAAEIAARGCRANAAASQALLDLTGGLPLYVQNAVGLAAAENAGSIADFCASVSARTHSVETAQELILTRVVEGLPEETRRAVAVLSLVDVPLLRPEVVDLLQGALGTDDVEAAGHLRRLRTAGVVETYGGDRLKVHDAVRLPAGVQLIGLGQQFGDGARRSLRDVLTKSLVARWDHRKLALHLRNLAATGDIKTLVQVGTEELFHELGLWAEIKPHLEAAASEATDPEDRFWALDGIVFNDMRVGEDGGTLGNIERMKRLVSEHGLGVRERMAVGMKEMNVLAREGDADGMSRVMASVAAELNPEPSYQRIFRYNAAVALFHVGEAEVAASRSLEIANEYYTLLGLTPKMVMGRNAPELRPLLKYTDSLPDDLKHLADCLDLHAKATDAAGGRAPFARIHALKFYDLARSPESLMRVGQDLADEFIRHNDYTGARQILENSLLPLLHNLRLAAYIIPVRSQHAVILAYCGDFGAAETEMERLAPYEPGLTDQGLQELRGQRRLIADLRQHGAPPQFVPPPGAPTTVEQMRKMLASGQTPTATESGFPPPWRHVRNLRKVGRNDRCPCGSGKKYKKCHGNV
ncbi:SEC-C metal-binding domain-containing protein [Bosea vaviloviae]|uniref:Uncharacterized protein n=1 Tax=Bosea vaviloviae TaxID=1526658 RepID=A0A1D7UCQ5_9HYPH|nr:ATP-binding protein [Bosea vaviloviae]AOO85147.1 hypothetical protein BHK69_31155 [Bosea vaviloviae]